MHPLRPSDVPGQHAGVTAASGGAAQSLRCSGAVSTSFGAQNPTDPRLDFFSREFDALLALYTPGLEPPNPRARPLDFLGKCRSLLPPECEEYVAPSGPRVKQAPRPEAVAAKQRALDRQEKVKEKEQQLLAQPPILHKLAEMVKDGPLSLLRRAMQQRHRVRVVTRHATGVRGVAVGYIQAFDRLCNLVLADVEEQYTVLLRFTQEREGDGGVLKSRTVRKQEHRRRHLAQVFLRGESVVLVSMLPLGTPTAAAAAPLPPPPPPPPTSVPLSAHGMALGPRRQPTPPSGGAGSRGSGGGGGGGPGWGR